MISREFEVQQHTDPFLKAGHDAEQQMAFYLRRAFADTLDVFVLHGLRLERSGEIAQIDHLVLHRHGAMIVESKSVSGSVSVNERGEWARRTGSQERGMPSPLLQGRRQAELLHSLLDDHDTALLGKTVGIQNRFGAMHLDVLVAISDSGLIQGGPYVPPEVCKADQVPDRIKALIKRYRSANSVFNLRLSALKDAGYAATGAELAGIAAFLNSRHQASHHPALSSQAKGKPLPATPPSGPPESSSPCCRYCQSTQISVQYGKYGYYFKCAVCGGNTPAKASCPECQQPGKLSKSGLRFQAQCPGGHQWTYFTNAQ